MQSDAAPPDPSQRGDPLAGTAYSARRRLGAGGHGEIFEAVHLELERIFVVKLIHEAFAADPRMNERFRVEARALAALKHPNIVEVTDFGRTPAGRPFFVMERLAGRTLSDELAARGSVSVHQAIDWICQALDGLEAMHAAGIVHRDIKPSNLFLAAQRNAPPIIKVLDFGIVKILDIAKATIAQPAFLTEEGVVIGTPKYVSPEQASGKPVDQRSDIYAVGLVLYTLLAGRGPFDHMRRDLALIAAHAKLDPDPPSRYAKEPIPADLDRALLRALAKAPADRFQSAAEFRAELERLKHATPHPASYETTLFDASLFAHAPSNPPEPPAARADVPRATHAATPLLASEAASSPRTAATRTRIAPAAEPNGGAAGSASRRGPSALFVALVIATALIVAAVLSAAIAALVP
jgi:serine/threonine protein kinase